MEAAIRAYNAGENKEAAIRAYNAGQVRGAAIRAYNAGQVRTWRQLSELIMLDK